MAEFDPMQWLALAEQRRKNGKVETEEMAGQFFATRDARRQGMGFMDSMQAGLKNRQAVMDPMFEMKKQQFQLGVLETASKIQQQMLSGQIRQKQLDDEAADNLSAANIIKQYGCNHDG